MRNNQPISQREVDFPAEQALVSVTDIKGRITYCNDAFIAISGFAREELLGQPHNIVRHPDMPQEAFRDMWATIQAGLPWTGLVKNRRKDGDHYWVQANATPLKDGERITGFLSVRTRPSREAVARAGDLYAGMNAQSQRGRAILGLHRGQVVRLDTWGRMGQMLKFGPGWAALLLQLAAATLVAMAEFAAPAAGWLAVLPVSVAAAWVAWRMALAPMRQAVADANHLAAGDLSHAVTTGATGSAGQLQQALKQMSVNLRAVVADTRAQAQSLREAAREVSLSSAYLSERTESQASSLQETAASIDQINSTAAHTADGAGSGADQASTAAEVAHASHGAVQAVASSMQGITAASSRIKDMVSVVESVAFQTNILALNAAVEASRAGDAGRGFAVVAAEVRSLAQRASEAASQIKALVQESTSSVSDGGDKVQEASRRMHEALNAVNHVSQTFQGIRMAAVEQQRGIAQVNEAVGQLDAITQHNAAMVEQLSAAAGSMHHQVDALSNSMRLFRLASGEQSVAEIDAVTLRREAKPRPVHSTASALGR